MSNRPEPRFDHLDSPTRSHVPAAETPTADWRPTDETTNEALAESALGEQLDCQLAALEAGHPLGATGSAEVDQLRPVVEQLHELADSLGPLPRSDGHPPHPSPPSQGGREDRTSSEQFVGKYQIVRQLGGGGQAAAHLAFDPDLRRHVVLKLYHEAQTPAEQEAVLQEGRALARVRSRYVAQVFAADRDRGVPYLVVEYIPGRNLAEVQRVKPLTESEALSIIGQLAEGLAAVHACGLLHRDLKPSNIMLGDDGIPRLVDFGLAANIGGEGLRRVSGTLAYMAPEQARGESERIDPRSDIFGLGAVLYMLLTGTPPHQADTRDALWTAAKGGDIIPPRERNPEIPKPINDLVLRCLAKDPGLRFSSASELGAAIRRVSTAETPSTPRRRPLLAALVAAAVLLVVGSAVLFAIADRSWYVNPFHLAEKTTPAFPTATKAAQPVPAVAPIVTTHPDGGRKLRQDFAVNVDLIGGQVDDKGVLNLVVDDVLSFRIETGRDCYVGLCQVDHEGNIVWLFPSEGEPDNLVTKDRPRVVPGEGRGRIRATLSAGPEYIYVLASTKPWKPVEGQKMKADGNVFTAAVTTEQKRAFRDQTRGLVLETPKPADNQAEAVTERVIHLQVKAGEK